MSRPEKRRLVRRLFTLALLMFCLTALGTSTGAPNAAPNKFLPCCSACDVENPPLACRRGCSPSCATDFE